MHVHRLCEPFTWAKYSKGLKRRILFPQFVGVITSEEIPSQQMRLVKGRSGDIAEGNTVVFHLVVDQEDGVIADAKFQCYGQTALIGAAETICAIVLRKNHLQAARISPEVIDKEVQERSTRSAFPAETFAHIQLALSALREALIACSDIPVAEIYAATPIDASTAEQITEVPNWLALSREEQLMTLREIVAQDVSPYVELDAGGVEVVDIKKGEEVLISYQGACTTCYAATGSTLSAIEHILRSRVYPHLRVIPRLG